MSDPSHIEETYAPFAVPANMRDLIPRACVWSQTGRCEFPNVAAPNIECGTRCVIEMTTQGNTVDEEQERIVLVAVKLRSYSRDQDIEQLVNRVERELRLQFPTSLLDVWRME